jgi:hypothetical protein
MDTRSKNDKIRTNQKDDFFLEDADFVVEDVPLRRQPCDVELLLLDLQGQVVDLRSQEVNKAGVGKAELHLEGNF